MNHNSTIQTNRYLPFVCLYFFCNSMLLPEGLLYTMILSPLFFYHIAADKNINALLAFTGVTILYMFIHIRQGVIVNHYIISFLIFQTVGIFCIWFYGFCRKVRSLEYLMTAVLWINIALVPIAFFSLYSGFLKEQFWYLVPISPGIPVVPRLKMFTYEASYYSLLLVPVVFYVFWDWLQSKNKRTMLKLAAVILLLVLSFSLGVIAGIIISLGLMALLNIRRMFSNKVFLLSALVILLLLVIGFMLLYHFSPENVLVARINNILEGKDTSSRGRTYEAFDLALIIARQKSVWFGVGLGQIKTLGRDIIIQYYQYMNMPSAVRIPNAVAETMAIYGFSGLIIRFGLIFYFFFKTGVHRNYFRLSVFLFVFVYQFTGSFIFNIAEYVIWILAFSPVLPQFNKPLKHYHG